MLCLKSEKSKFGKRLLYSKNLEQYFLQSIRTFGLGKKIIALTWDPPRGRRDGVIRHILERENGNWMEKIALFRE